MWTPSLRKFIRLAKTTMDAVLLDTDVFSYLTKIGDTRGDAYRPHVLGKTVSISLQDQGAVGSAGFSKSSIASR
jgi:hypothetical protein